MKIFLLLFLIFTSLFSKDTIRWMLWDLPPNFILKGEEKGKILTALGIEKQCCRTLFLTHVDLIDLAAQYKKV